MDSLGENMRRLILAGIGAVAVTAEKSQAMLDELVKKGELTVAQGQVLNEELKHGIKQKIKENVTVSVVLADPDSLKDAVASMTPAQIAQLKELLSQMEGSAHEPAAK